VPARVLVVDRSAATRDAIADLLGDLADVAWCAPAGAAAQLRARSVDVVVVDADASSLVRELAATGTRVVVIGDAGLAVKAGAADAIARPFVAAELVLRVARAAGAADKLRRPRKSDVLIGAGAWIAELYDRIAMVAATDASVAIFGESGTGKELVARTIHTSSPRRDAPFVVVNCAAIPEPLIEDELFGHVRGAFTDASRDREGLIAAAHTGTLFLDEIGELPLALQAKLLRVLQSQEFRRLGDDQDRRVDVRIITATNRDLDALIARGSFRQDLFYRIAVFPLHLPPLRDRPDDIPLLVHHFVQKYRTRLGKQIEGVSPAALARFAHHPYPGNVRELENKVQQAMVVAAGATIEDEDVAPPQRPGTHRIDLARSFRDLKHEAIDAFETAYLTELLRTHKGNLASAARAAGMDRKNLWALVVRHSLDRARFKG
jgi:DNA-binding NtrC family response regulator